MYLPTSDESIRIARKPHNHPSGCPDPSTEDVEFTASIRRASELFGIELYDHLIVTADGFTSLRERGLL